ncbi:MAG: hypothetical protein ACJAVI_001207 [Candidatus Azotimanducaceae bacterium]|jgi:hypothetical protein
MLPTPRSQPQASSSGAAIIIFITLVLLVFTTILIAQISVNKNKSARMQNNSQVLDLTQSAIFGFALSHPIPGTLPCPDTNGDGSENTMAGGCTSQLGLLPYFTLGLDNLDDSSGSDLWYAVETSYTVNAAGQRNSSTPSAITLNGQPVSHVIIAPGIALEGQNRSPLTQANFLEGINADSNLNTYDNITTDTQNDVVLGSPLSSFWTLIEQRVLAEAHLLTTTYHTVCNQYPWAANFGGPYTSVPNQQIGSLPFAAALPFNWGAPCVLGIAPTPTNWLVTHWSDQLFYHMCTNLAGNCLTVKDSGSSPAAAIILAPGSRLSGQTRPTAVASDYFEAENVSLPDEEYRAANPIDHSGGYNDLSNPLP